MLIIKCVFRKFITVIVRTTHLKSIFIITNHIIFSKVKDQKESCGKEICYIWEKNYHYATDCSTDGSVGSNCSAVPEREQ